MMEFPLFPVFLDAAVQTLPIPWGWAGLGKSACLPIIHLAALEREQSTRTHGLLCLHGERCDTVCLFSTSSPSFACLSLSGTNTRWNFLTNGRPTKYHSYCSPCFSVCWGLYWSRHQCGWQYTEGQFSACLFMSPSILVFRHLAQLRSTFSKSVSLPVFHFPHRYED